MSEKWKRNSSQKNHRHHFHPFSWTVQQELSLSLSSPWKKEEIIRGKNMNFWQVEYAKNFSGKLTKFPLLVTKSVKIFHGNISSINLNVNQIFYISLFFLLSPFLSLPFFHSQFFSQQNLWWDNKNQWPINR